MKNFGNDAHRRDEGPPLKAHAKKDGSLDAHDHFSNSPAEDQVNDPRQRAACTAIYILYSNVKEFATTLVQDDDVDLAHLRL
jgi:hypothetical protein